MIVNRDGQSFRIQRVEPGKMAKMAHLAEIDNRLLARCSWSADEQHSGNVQLGSAESLDRQKAVIDGAEARPGDEQHRKPPRLEQIDHELVVIDRNHEPAGPFDDEPGIYKRNPEPEQGDRAAVEPRGFMR